MMKLYPNNPISSHDLYTYIYQYLNDNIPNNTHISIVKIMDELGIYRGFPKGLTEKKIEEINKELAILVLKHA